MNHELIVILDFGGQYCNLIARRVRECGVYCEVKSYKTPLETLKAMNPKGIILTGGPNSVYDKTSPSYTADLMESGIPVLGICYGAQLMAHLMNPKGIILTGGPNSVYDKTSPSYTADLMESGIPVLGICYGAQLMAHLLGGRVETAVTSEFGGAQLEVMAGHSLLFAGAQKSSQCWMSHTDYIAQAPKGMTVTAKTPFGGAQLEVMAGHSLLFAGAQKSSQCWMSHTDYIAQAPKGMTVTAKTPVCPCAAMEDAERKLYAVQFHPEVAHCEDGMLLLDNFLKKVCGCSGDWEMSGYAKDMVKALREKIGDKKVLCALSGGVDSTVAAALVHRAVGDQLTCMFVDHGLLRKNEGDSVERICSKQLNMKLIRINAQDRFLGRLKGVSAPEEKRKIIGEEFIRVFEEEGRKLGKMNFLVQGTIYPDVIESGTDTSAVIKSHHNVGGLPDVIDFDDIVEPLRLLFKDEVRRLGLELGIPEELVWRQPFPGPGLAVRIIGEITPDKVALLQDADAIFREEIKNAGLEREINQYFAVLTDMRSVGVMGDGRTYDYTVALRGVTTSDFMTADFARIPYDVLAKASSRIVNEVKGVNRVCYDITAKPPATIEWE